MNSLYEKVYNAVAHDMAAENNGRDPWPDHVEKQINEMPRTKFLWYLSEALDQEDE